MADQQTAVSGDTDDWDAPPSLATTPASTSGATSGATPEVDGSEPAVNPAEQEALARDLGEELTDVFVRYVRGEVDFADLSFLTYDLLHDLHIVASGAYELEYDDEDDANGDLDDTYDDSAATDQQEDLAQEPAGP